MALCSTGRPPCSWASTVLRVSPQTWERSHLTAILKPRKVWCVFLLVFFPGSRAVGLAREAAQRLLIGSPHRGCSPVLPLPSPPLISLQIKEG